DPYWSVRPVPLTPHSATADGEEGGEEQVVLRGAVLVHLKGRTRGAGFQPASSALQAGSLPHRPAPELAAAFAGPSVPPGRELFRLGRGTGRLSLLILALGLVLAAGASVLEAVLLRGVFELSGLLALPEQRLLAVGCLAGFAAVLLLLELGVAGALARLGR